MNLIPLPGCSPTPLAHYLKALGVLRLLDEQLPPEPPRPRGAWQGETFVLHSPLDRPALEAFFLHDYRPTPILAPWNGGSGFHPGDNRVAIRAIRRSAHPRLDPYRQALRSAAGILARHLSRARRLPDYRAALASSSQPKDRAKGTAKALQTVKPSLLLACRQGLPQDALAWFDAALVLTDDGAKFPPLLGTGGNDGRLDFTNNFMQRLGAVFDPATGRPVPDSAELLAGSLFAEPTRGLRDEAIGQFFPHAAGGLNATSGFDAKALVNPWDFVLMIEGALLFAAAAVKRLESAQGPDLAYPFCVHPTGSGYATASEADAGARCELWVPLWARPASAAELRHVLSEGRARLKNRAARDGFEFTRAVAQLGVDRGLSAFHRYSFAQRNGLAYFATPLDRVPVRRHPAATELLDDLDRLDWLDRLRSAARGDRVPNRITDAVRALERCAVALLRSSQVAAEERRAGESLLHAVTDTELAISRSLRWSEEKRLEPLPGLASPRWWSSLVDPNANDPELDLAAGLAFLGPPSFRVHWEPLALERPYPDLKWNATSREVLWQEDRLEQALLSVHQRRILLREAGHRDALHGPHGVRPASVAAFLARATDDVRIARLARALSLIRRPEDPGTLPHPSAGPSDADAAADLPVLFSLPRLALAGSWPDHQEPIPRLAAILRRGESEDGESATRLAAQRLRASGFQPAIEVVPIRGRDARRALAATLFPLDGTALIALGNRLRPISLH